MPQRSDPVTKDVSGRKQKARSKSIKRRKSAGRRRSSGGQDDPIPKRPTTPNGSTNGVRAHLCVEGTDAIRRCTLNADVMTLVSPESYKEYTEVGREYKSTACHSPSGEYRCTVSHSGHGKYEDDSHSAPREYKSTTNHVTSGKTEQSDDHVSVCSVSSYTRSRIENIVQNADILNSDNSSTSSTISNGCESVKQDTGMKASRIHPSLDPEATLVDTDTDLVDNVSEYLSVDSDLDLESRRKTLEWLNASDNSVPDRAMGQSGAPGGRRGRGDASRETRRISLHIPQAGNEKGEQRSTCTTDHNNPRLSVVLTNGMANNVTVAQTEKPKPKPKHVSLAIASDRQAWSSSPVSRDFRPASAHAHERHAELQQQSERLLLKKKKIMEQFRLKRWVPILPDTIAIDDLIVINTIRKEMHQGANQPTVNKTTNGFPAPHLATNYDVDSEHQYIMDKALRSYREHRAKEPETASLAPEVASRNSADATRRRRTQSATVSRPVVHVSVPYMTSASHVTSASPEAGKLSRRPSTAQPRLADSRYQQTPGVAAGTPNPGTIRIPQSESPYHADLTTQSSTHGAQRRLPPNRIQVTPSMDRAHTNKGSDPKRQGQGRRQVEGSFFSSTRPKRQYFSIHPEWVSENFSVQSISIKQRMNGNNSSSSSSHSPERRCYSAPPPRTRNPITWENPDMNELRLRDTRLRAVRGRPTNRPKSEVMDAIGCGADRQEKVPKFNIRSTFFATTNSPRRQYFTIHPEWQSESGQTRKVVPSYQERTMTYPVRRCKSAPPPRTRNPITWDYADRPDRR